MATATIQLDAVEAVVDERANVASTMGRGVIQTFRRRFIAYFVWRITDEIC